MKKAIQKKPAKKRALQTRSKKRLMRKSAQKEWPQIELVASEKEPAEQKQSNRGGKSSLKVCSLTKLKTLTSSIHLNKELQDFCELTIMDWPYYGKLKATFAPLLNMGTLYRAIHDYDILHIQYDIAGYMPLFLPIVWLLSWNKRAKIVLSLHEKYDNVPLASLVIAFHNVWYRQADALLVHTTEHKEFLAPLLRTRTFVIPHGVIETPGVKHDFLSNMILFAGYVNGWKGHDLAVNAMPLVLKDVPDAKLIFLSRPNDLKYEAAVRKLGKDLKLDYVVEWHDKRIEEWQMFEYFDKAAISLLPYRRVTMSGILSHTLSRGVPAVLSDLPPFVEVTKGRALYFKNGDYRDLAHKIIELLKDKNLQRQMSKDFMALAKEYAWNRMARLTMKVYEDLMKETAS